MSLERSLKIPKDVIDVMAQTKWPMENTTHPNASVKRFKEMRKPQKRRKWTKGGGLDSKLSNF